MSCLSRFKKPALKYGPSVVRIHPEHTAQNDRSSALLIQRPVHRTGTCSLAATSTPHHHHLASWLGPISRKEEKRRKAVKKTTRLIGKFSYVRPYKINTSSTRPNKLSPIPWSDPIRARMEPAHVHTRALIDLYRISHPNNQFGLRIIFFLRMQ